jgi:lipopolysaccharide export system protein LptA
MKFFLALLLTMASAFGQGKITARVKNFEANPEREGKRIFIKGQDYDPAANGLVTKPHIETFKLNGTVDMIIDAASAYYDQATSNDVWSEKDFATRSADGQIALKGVGFRWQTSQSQLSVSNKVEAVIRRDAVASAGASTNNIRVTSDQMIYTSDLVTFTGSVHVIDWQGEVWCRLLKVRMDATNTVQQIEAFEDVVIKQKDATAQGKHALYVRATGLLRLNENTSWKMADREGESELLIIDRTNNTFRAENNVRMTLPSSLVNTNSATTNKVKISADTFDYAPTNRITGGAIAIYNGNVHAIDPQAILDCELLTVYFNETNKVVRGVAERSVVITRPATTVRGDKAVFENEEVTVTGKPVWRHEEKSGTSEILVFNPKTSEIRAIDVQMQIPFTTGTNLLFGASTKTTNAPTTLTNILLVTSKYFTNREKVATFAQNVRAIEPRGQMDANLVNVFFNATNRPTRILAEGDVIITELKTQALGQRADYNLETGLIHLTGVPKVMTGTNFIFAREIIFDRNTGKVKYLPPFFGEMRREAQ